KPDSRSRPSTVEVVREEFSMLARATRHVEHRVRSRMLLANQRTNLVHFLAIVLERIHKIVGFDRFGKHTTLRVIRPSKNGGKEILVKNRPIEKPLLKANRGNSSINSIAFR